MLRAPVILLAVTYDALLLMLCEMARMPARHVTRYACYYVSVMPGVMLCALLCYVDDNAGISAATQRAIRGHDANRVACRLSRENNAPPPGQSVTLCALYTMLMRMRALL